MDYDQGFVDGVEEGRRQIIEQAEQEPVHVENVYKRGDKYFAWIGDDYVQIYAAPQTPDVCGEVCERANLCYGCGKNLDEANAEHALQKLSDFHQHIEETEPKCNQHPDAPHGFDRNASHNAGRYVCECEGWEPDRAEQEHDGHWSDCSTYNEPAYPNGECDCGGYLAEQEPVASVLPCPFCGDNKPTVFEGSTFRWRVAVCNNCGAYAPEVRHDTLAEDQKQAGIESDAAAITAWNTRAAPIRTKNLTNDELLKVVYKDYGKPMSPTEIARAVIAADREKNK